MPNLIAVAFAINPPEQPRIKQLILDDRRRADIDTNAGRGRLPMIVTAILSNKGGSVITIEPTATLETAVKTLAEHKIGALIVLGPDRRVIGILSERDIVRVLAEQGAGVLTQPLAQIMTRKVVTCSQMETVGTIMERMTTGKFRHVPVIEQDQVVGIISIGDVVKHRLWEIERRVRGIAGLHSIGMMRSSC